MARKRKRAHETARDAVAYLEGSMPEQWRQVYCGLTPFLVSDRGNVRLIDGSEPRMMLANGRYQIAYKPEEQHLRDAVAAVAWPTRNAYTVRCS